MMFRNCKFRNCCPISKLSDPETLTRIKIGHLDPDAGGDDIRESVAIRMSSCALDNTIQLDLCNDVH